MVLIGTLTQVIWRRLRQFSTKPLFYSDISPLIFICGIFIVSKLIFNCCAGRPTHTKISGEYIAIKLWSGGLLSRVGTCRQKSYKDKPRIYR